MSNLKFVTWEPRSSSEKTAFNRQPFPTEWVSSPEISETTLTTGRLAGVRCVLIWPFSGLKENRREARRVAKDFVTFRE